MAAPLGFKTFATGDVLTAADTNGYLMQGIWVFADATARDAAVTSPQEGNTCYLKDTDNIMVYSGSAWVTKSGGATAVNLLLNSNFAINQRGYVSAANLASGAYGFDRWKSNYTDTTLTFTASTQGQSLTINASGGIQQVIEQGLVPAGTYTLSWTGTATARVYNSGGTPPSYAASPVTFTADGTANVVVEFTAVSTTKTVSKVQFNAGSNTTWALATPTLQSELTACQRYCYVVQGNTTNASSLGTGYWNGSTNVVGFLSSKSQMRTTPTLIYSQASDLEALQVGVSWNAVTAVAIGAEANAYTAQFGVTTTGGTSGQAANVRLKNLSTAYIGLVAEL
jgi:hypothetical protein